MTQFTLNRLCVLVAAETASARAGADFFTICALSITSHTVGDGFAPRSCTATTSLVHVDNAVVGCSDSRFDENFYSIQYDEEESGDYDLKVQKDLELSSVSDSATDLKVWWCEEGNCGVCECKHDSAEWFPL